MKLGKNKIFIVAEIGNNHEGRFSVAKKLIKKAKEAGVDAVKFQVFKPELYYHASDVKRINNLKKFQLSFNQFLKLKRYSKKLKIKFFASAFDLDSLNFLIKNIDLIKVSSSDNNNFIFFDKIFKNKKKCIVSTGLLENNEIKLFIKKLEARYSKKTIKKNLGLLHCVASYPAKQEDLNLDYIEELKNKYDFKIGYSDHSLGPDACIVAASLGAEIIEKHFTLNKNYSTFRDHKISSDPKEMKNLVRTIRKIEVIKGNKIKKLMSEEKSNLKILRRSFYALKKLNKGEKLNISKISALRPKVRNSINLENIDNFINKKVKKSYKKNDVLLTK